MTPRRDWSEARKKIESEARCRRCLRNDVPLDAAHVIGRSRDKPRVEGSTSRVLFVHPSSVIPLCRSCHAAYDLKEATILPFLTLEEQIRAVEDAGSIETARRRLDPLDYTEEIRQARIESQARAGDRGPANR